MKTICLAVVCAIQGRTYSAHVTEEAANDIRRQLDAHFPLPNPEPPEETPAFEGMEDAQGTAPMQTVSDGSSELPSVTTVVASPPAETPPSTPSKPKEKPKGSKPPAKKRTPKKTSETAE